jgi:hypothetical protein
LIQAAFSAAYDLFSTTIKKMNMTTLQMTSEEVAEIEKHKYFLSEKAGCDVGWEAAEQDWLTNYADQFRGATHSKSNAEAGSGIRIYLKRLLVKVGKH